MSVESPANSGAELLLSALANLFGGENLPFSTLLCPFS